MNKLPASFAEKIKDGSVTIAIIGLGYVGLPLAVEFGKYFTTIGFDINKNRVSDLNNHVDKTLEVSAEELAQPSKLMYTSNIDELHNVDIFIVSVPTPIDVFNRPDLTPLIKASETVGKVLKKENIVIYESTVYPGCTEEECVPILEKLSGLKFNTDFYCGYSPERINPGDKQHRLPTIKKIVSGSTAEIGKVVNQLYSTIITAGTFLASSIKVAEAAKVIENTQRDINIAFVNELAQLFNLMNIDTSEVLEAAGTKWNFLPFRPGLVGGHCIGVDPYYLTHKSTQLGHHPEIILAGRRINDSMGAYIAHKVIKNMIQNNLRIKESSILILGITFKENCPDIRNSKVLDIIKEIKDYGCSIDVYDPVADPKEVFTEYGINLVSNASVNDFSKYQMIVLAVAHNELKSLPFAELHEKGILIYDVKGIINKNDVTDRL